MPTREIGTGLLSNCCNGVIEVVGTGNGMQCTTCGKDCEFTTEFQRAVQGVKDELWDAIEPPLRKFVEWLSPLIPKWVDKLPDVNAWSVIIPLMLFYWGMQAGAYIAYFLHSS